MVRRRVSLLLGIAGVVLVVGAILSYVPFMGAPRFSSPEAALDAEKARSIGLNPGDLAPDFSVVSIDGETIRLSELFTRSRPLVVYFFATWCSSCARDFSVLKKLYPEYSDRVLLLAVDMDPTETREEVEAYRMEKGFTWTFALGNEEVLMEYNVVSSSIKYGIAGDGRISFSAGYGSLSEVAWVDLFHRLTESA